MPESHVEEKQNEKRQVCELAVDTVQREGPEGPQCEEKLRIRVCDMAMDKHE